MKIYYIFDKLDEYKIKNEFFKKVKIKIQWIIFLKTIKYLR